MLSFLLFLKTDVRKNNHSCWRTSSKEAWVIVSSHFIERLIASSSMLHDSLNVLVKWSTVPGIMRSLSIMAISRGPVFFQADALSTIYDISLCNARFARANFPFGLALMGENFRPWWQRPFCTDSIFHLTFWWSMYAANTDNARALVNMMKTLSSQSSRYSLFTRGMLQVHEWPCRSCRAVLRGLTA